MTCIVGLETPTGVIIGGDSAGVSGWDLDVRADTKVFTRGSMAYGFTTSFRMGQILRYAPEHHWLNGPDDATESSLDAWMATDFIDHVRDALKAGGYAKQENSTESGGTFLVGVRGRLYCVHSDYQIERTVSGFNAVGCGSQVALGAMWATQRILGEYDPWEQVEYALDAAERFSGGVRGPMHFVEV